MRINNTIGKVIAIIISTAFSIYFFLIRHLFNEKPIFYIDHGGYISLLNFVKYSLIPEFQSSYGYTDALHMGYPLLPFFPLGFFVICAFISFCGISYPIAYKIMIFVILELYGLFPYIILQKYQRSIISSWITQIWIWIGMNFFWLQRMDTGAVESTLSAILVLFFFITIKQINYHIDNPISSTKGIIQIGLLFFIGYINYIYIIFLVIVLGEYVIFTSLKSQNWKKELFIIGKYYIIIGISSLLLSSFWILPTLLIHMQYFPSHLSNRLYTYEYSMQFNLKYLQANFIGLSVIILGLIYMLVKYNTPDIQKMNIFIYLFFTSGILVFLAPVFQISFFTGVNSYRYLVFFELSGMIFVGFIFDQLITDLKRWAKKMETPNIRIEKIFLCAILIIAFIDIIPFRSPHLTYREHLIGNQSVNYSEIEPEDQNIIDYLRTNTSQQSRILIQNSGDESNFILNSGHNIGNFAYYSNRSFATGFSVDLFWNYSLSTNYLDENLFGRNLTSYSIEELKYYFQMYNIEFIITWSHNSSVFWNQLVESTTLIENIYTTNKYQIFQYKNASKSFIIADSEYYITNLHKTNISAEFHIEGISANREIIYSLHDYPNWQIYVNGIKIQKNENFLGLISFNLPENSSNFNEIKIIWEKLKIETTGDIISITTIAFIFISIIHKNRSVQKGRFKRCSV